MTISQILFSAGAVILPSIAVPVSIGSRTTTAVIQSNVGLTTTAGIPGGALALVAVFAPSGSTNSITGVSDGTNTYTRAVQSVWDVGTDSWAELWYKENAVGISSGAVIVATYAAATNAQPSVISGAYVTGILSSTSLDTTNNGTTVSGTAYASGSTGTLAKANEIAIGFMGEYNASTTVTDGSGFININTTTQGSGAFFNTKLSYQIVAATTALNYQPSTSVATFGKTLIATFKGF